MIWAIPVQFQWARSQPRQMVPHRQLDLALDLHGGPATPRHTLLQLSRREADETTTWFSMIRTAEFVPRVEHALGHDVVVALVVPCVWEHASMHCINIQPCVAVVLHGSYGEGCMRC
jgi:hypothetical protein